MNKKAEADFFNHSYDTKARSKVGQIYSIIHGRNEVYEKEISDGVAGLRVLEYGCGEGSHSLELASLGGEVVGIDISEIGIRNAQEVADRKGIKNVDYLVMDAENMTFGEDEFDLIIGEGILHHLDLEKSYREIARVLKAGGRAVFMEPLGHNLAINIFRSMTPRLRTDDEHPLVRSDLKMAGRYFELVDLQFFHLVSFASMAFLKTPWFFPVVRFLDKIDATIFRMIPRVGMLSWYTIIKLSQPKTKGDFDEASIS